MTIKQIDLRQFQRAYLVCALWSSIDEAGEPLDEGYDINDIAAETISKMHADCKDFYMTNLADLTYFAEHCAASDAGHDFWLTRSGHGTGFWDRGLGEVGERLTAAAKVYGSCDLYVGDDGLLYV